MPPSRLDTQRSIANLRDVAGIARAVSFCLSTSNRNVAAFEIERLLLELTERLGERPHVNARPDGVRRVRVKRAERVLIPVERGRDGARFGGQPSGRRTGRRDGRWWRQRGSRR